MLALLRPKISNSKEKMYYGPPIISKTTRWIRTVREGLSMTTHTSTYSTETLQATITIRNHASSVKFSRRQRNTRDNQSTQLFSKFNEPTASASEFDPPPNTKQQRIKTCFNFNGKSIQRAWPGIVRMHRWVARLSRRNGQTMLTTVVIRRNWIHWPRTNHICRMTLWYASRRSMTFSRSQINCLWPITIHINTRHKSSY